MAHNNIRQENVATIINKLVSYRTLCLKGKHRCSFTCRQRPEDTEQSNLVSQQEPGWASQQHLSLVGNGSQVTEGQRSGDVGMGRGRAQLFPRQLGVRGLTESVRVSHRSEWPESSAGQWARSGWWWGTRRRPAPAPPHTALSPRPAPPRCWASPGLGWTESHLTGQDSSEDQDIHRKKKNKLDTLQPQTRFWTVSWIINQRSNKQWLSLLMCFFWLLMLYCKTQAVRSNSIKKKEEEKKKELGLSMSASCQRPEVEGQQPRINVSNIKSTV